MGTPAGGCHKIFSAIPTYPRIFPVPLYEFCLLPVWGTTLSTRGTDRFTWHTLCLNWQLALLSLANVAVFQSVRLAETSLEDRRDPGLDGLNLRQQSAICPKLRPHWSGICPKLHHKTSWPCSHFLPYLSLRSLRVPGPSVLKREGQGPYQATLFYPGRDFCTS